jgi:LPS-assembly lipoprotein
MRRFAPLFCLVLAGCGFHPLYAVPGENHGETQAIYVEPMPDRIGYELRNQLIDILDARAESAGATYRLRVTLAEKKLPIGIQSQAVPSGAGAAVLTQTVITRYNDTLTVEYDLIDLKTNKSLTHGVESGLSAYNVLTSPYATLAAQRDADKRAADDIADRVRLDLAVYFAGQKKTTQ